MSKKRTLILLHSGESGKEPEVNDLKYGEIAINHSKDEEFIATKVSATTTDSDGNTTTAESITKFSSDTVRDKKLAEKLKDKQNVLVEKKADTADTIPSTANSIYITDEDALDAYKTHNTISVGNLDAGVYDDFMRGDDEVGGIVWYDTSTKKTVKWDRETFYKNANEMPYNVIPIGVIVIPSTHDVYGTGEAAMISLTDMSCSSPDTGAISGTSNSTGTTYLYWGNNGVDISGITNHVSGTVNSFNTQKTDDYGKYVISGTHLESGGYNVPTEVTGQGNASLYVPDTWSLKTGETGEGSTLIVRGNESCCISMYDANGYIGENVGIPNKFPDFKGKENTDAVLSNSVYALGDWTTSTSITNSSSAGYAPAFECCWRYHTSGTKQGDWYLPSVGELGYMQQRLYTINKTLGLIAEKTSVNVRTIATSSIYWSSSEYSAYYAWNLSTSNGYVGSYYKNGYRLVRAFCRV